MTEAISFSPDVFSEILYEKMKRINPGIEDMELYEFRYALDNLYPENGGWASVKLDSVQDIEQRINTRDFYAGIQLKPQVDGKIVLDENILQLTNMLLVGLITGDYSEEWIRAHFISTCEGFTFWFGRPISLMPCWRILVASCGKALSRSKSDSSDARG